MAKKNKRIYQKIIFFIMLFLCGCAFSFTEDYKNLDSHYKIDSCQMLEKHYNAFYTKENQKCLENAGLSPDILQEFSSNDNFIQIYLEASKCRAGDNFSFADIRKNPDIYQYYSQKFETCKVSSPFENDNVKLLLKYYKFFENLSFNTQPNKLEKFLSSIDDTVRQNVEQHYNMKRIILEKEKNYPQKMVDKRIKEEKQKAQMDAEYEKAVRDALADPLVIRFKSAAPNFSFAKIGKCPFFFFVKNLRLLGKNNSDFLFYKKYKFRKIDDETLEISLDDQIIGIFLKKKDNNVLITQFGDSKDIMMNQLTARNICYNNDLGWIMDPVTDEELSL